MSSVAERPDRRLADAATTWNRKLHIYTGLYFLFFLWLFSFTGLLLNHSGWTFADFWPARKASTFERTIARPPLGADVIQAKDIMRQLGIEGEIEWTKSRSGPNRLEFRVSRPGQMFEIKANLEQDRAKVQRIAVNGWGVVRILHTFTGVRISDTRNQRDWSLTTLWALSMDALAIGLILMIATGVWMWWSRKQNRLCGAAALVFGVLSCGFFVLGLRFLF